MPDLKVAFWNVKDLFEPGCGALRAPGSAAELDAKIAAIADVLSSLFDGAGPDLIGLCEIHTERILSELIRRLGARYRVLWEPCLSPHPHPGLAVLARSSRFGSLTHAGAYPPATLARPRYLIARCALKENDIPFFFVVNHWRSRAEIDGPDPDGADDRLRTARALGAWLDECPRTTCVVVVGDFNAEPFEQPFAENALWTARHLGPRLSLPYPCLYNTAWRFLSEPDPCEHVLAAEDAYRASRTKTTYDAYNTVSVVFDQLLVSSRAIRGGPIMLQEKTVQYEFDHRIGRLQRGHLRPRAWSYEAENPAGVSDHFPLTARFRVATET